MPRLGLLALALVAAPLAAQPTVIVAHSSLEGETLRWLDRHLHVYAEADEPGPREIVLVAVAIEDGEVQRSVEIETVAYGHPEAERLARRPARDLPDWDAYLEARAELAEPVRELFPGNIFFPGDLFFPGNIFDEWSALLAAREAAPEAVDSSQPLIVFFAGEGSGAVFVLRKKPAR
ncbi:MAG: hypothetical protein AAGI52_07605 [Bacteroidota bacterium]